MSPRRIVFLLIAFVAAGVAVVGIRLATQRPAPVEAPPPVVAAPEKPQTMVLVARGDLKVGQFIRPDSVRWQAWPDDGVAPTYLLKAQHDEQEFYGAVVRSSLGDGEPLTLNRILRPGDVGFLAAVLQPGKRAVTVNLTAAGGVSGLIFPGDHVDLLATLTLTDPEGKEKIDHHAAETVLSNLKVLALDQRLDPQGLSSKEAKDAQIAKTATLEVTPKEAEIIAVVAEIGRLTLSLRSLGTDGSPEQDVASNDGDPNQGSDPTYTFDSDATKIIQPPGAHSHGPRVIVYRGGTGTEVDFISGGGGNGGMQNSPPKSPNDEDH
ncbi:MAG TPA: Flp pilus assembly protein CpaB [Stellaceae bacterium]|nr:Flp pilus assembly protein CpaB [Stellaceae bacterium]